jgi:hypothetical protein
MHGMNIKIIYTVDYIKYQTVRIAEEVLTTTHTEHTMICSSSTIEETHCCIPIF